MCGIGFAMNFSHKYKIMSKKHDLYTYAIIKREYKNRIFYDIKSGEFS